MRLPQRLRQDRATVALALVLLGNSAGAIAAAGGNDNRPGDSAAPSAAGMHRETQSPGRRAAADEHVRDDGASDDEDDDEDDDDDDVPAGANPPGHPATEQEEAQATGWGGEVDLLSRYIWRGMALSDGPVAQLSGSVSFRGFTAELWANTLLMSEPPRGRISAVEPNVSYEYVGERWRIEPLITGYWLREEVRGVLTAEAECKVSYNMGPLRLETTQAIDIARYLGSYIGTLGPALEHRAGRGRLRVFVDAAWASPRFNDEMWGERRWALEYVEAGMDVRAALSDVAYVAVQFLSSTLITPSLRRASNEPTLGSVGLLLGLDM